MIQKDKELLLKDLCTRLPYGVKVLNIAEGVNEVGELDSIMTSRKYKDKIFVGITLPNDSIMTGIEIVKPYLRPISSITKEEEIEFSSLIENTSSYFERVLKELDWLNKKMFDHQGLIPMGLALEAPDGMYKF